MYYSMDVQENLVAMDTLREKWEEMHNLRWNNYVCKF